MRKAYRVYLWIWIWIWMWVFLLILPCIDLVAVGLGVERERRRLLSQFKDKFQGRQPEPRLTSDRVCFKAPTYLYNIHYTHFRYLK